MSPSCQSSTVHTCVKVKEESSSEHENICRKCTGKLRYGSRKVTQAKMPGQD